MNPPKLLIIDAMGLLYRAHFALYRQAHITNKGVATGALFGFINSLLEVVEKRQPTHIALAFDLPMPTWRHQLFPPYKAQRQAQPEAITLTLPLLYSFLEAMSMTVIKKKGHEADDLIGSLAFLASRNGFLVEMVSNDKDLGQLVSSKRLLYRLSVGGKPALLCDEPIILAEWGLRSVSQIPDALALYGDLSDNIAGIPQIGPQKAAALLQRFESLEMILEQKEQLAPALAKRLNAHKEKALLAKKLATIKTDLKVGIKLESLARRPPERSKLTPLLEKLELRTLAKRLLGEELPISLPLFTSKKPAVVKQILSGIEAEKAFSKLAKSKQIAIWIDLDQEKYWAINIRSGPTTSAYFPYPANVEQRQSWLLALNRCLGGTSLKIGERIKETITFLSRFEVKIAPPYFDTMIASHLLRPEQSNNLADLSKTYLREHLTEKGTILWQLAASFEPQLNQAGMKKIFSLEMKVLPILAAMEKVGIAINKQTLNHLSDLWGKQLIDLLKELEKIAGHPFNPDSPKQLGEILFGELKLLKNPPKTPKGQFATNEKVLNRLKGSHPIITTLRHYRQLKKLRSTYVTGLLPSITAAGRIHTNYQQEIVVTGRLSSRKPNLQNIPIRTSQGKALREAFHAKEGHLLLSADYNQIELRIMAHLSEDPLLVNAFVEKEDLHSKTAAELFALKPCQVTAAMRNQAKAVNFGILYGISAHGLAQQLTIPRRKAAEMIEQYWDRFPGVRTYQKALLAKGRALGYVTTLLGRRRYLPDLTSRNATIRTFAERNAINMPIQGSAAELIKMAMVAITDWLKKDKLSTRLILQVHDELIFESPLAECDNAIETIRQKMERVLPLKVPLEVSTKKAKNWSEAH